jgi:hypothetical protein
MHKHWFNLAWASGALAVAWVGFGFWVSNPLALGVTLLIGVVYALGTQELRLYRLATAQLSGALQTVTAPVANLEDWLQSVPSALQNSVRLRVEGERVGLPGPALTPYLVGLLVMLGMLGTFLGMVVTLNGAVFALEGTSSIQAIRAAFSEPIKGLGLAFGTSVAGVATSAALGLMSAISRRERMQAAHGLDTLIASHLRAFSLSYQRQETFKALQLQSQALPQVVEKLQDMMTQMERMSQQLSDRLLSNQENFHNQVKVAYTDLASTVDQSLKDSLQQSAKVAGESMLPALETALAGMARESQGMHERLVTTWHNALAEQEKSQAQWVTQVSQSLASFTDRVDQRSQSLVSDVREAQAAHQSAQAAREDERLQAWQAALTTMAAGLEQTAHTLSSQAQANARQLLEETRQLVGASEALIQSRIDTESQWASLHGQRMDQMASVLKTELSALREEEALRGQAAVARLAELETALAAHLTTLGTALEAPITRLIHTASEAPRAAAEVIGKLREEVSHSVARDNELLEERSRILETLNALLNSIHHASTEQRAVIDSLVASSAVALDQAGSQLAERMASQTDKLSGTTAQLNGSAIEVAALSEALVFAVKAFGDANDKLIGNMERIEKAIDQSMTRSDEQLAYYVAQAREVIDLSIASHKEIFEELRKLPSTAAAPA